jgi:hypothetical protein
MDDPTILKPTRTLALAAAHAPVIYNTQMQGTLCLSLGNPQGSRRNIISWPVPEPRCQTSVPFVQPREWISGFILQAMRLMACIAILPSCSKSSHTTGPQIAALHLESIGPAWSSVRFMLCCVTFSWVPNRGGGCYQQFCESKSDGTYDNKGLVRINTGIQHPLSTVASRAGKAA